MVDLPKYVKPQTNKVGRTYYYYERFRNTPKALPRLLLPFSPQAPEFWLRAGQCVNLNAERIDGGVWKWSYLAESGRAYNLCDPKAGIDAFWQDVDNAESLEKSRVAGTNKTFSALIDLYRDHEAYKSLSKSSQGDYERYLGIIAMAWADEPVASLTAEAAQGAIDEYQDAPASGRYFRSVLSKLVAFGVPRGFAASNCVEFTEKPKQNAEPYKPWPDWAFELFFKYARPSLHLPVLSAFYTGQRKVDIIAMMRPKRGADSIEIYARKIKKKVWVKVHSEYRGILEAALGDNVKLHCREDGEAWTYEGFATAWTRELSFTAEKNDPPEMQEKAAAMKRLRDEKLVFHGLRKNAVNMLLESGCTEAEVSSVVEMSEQMVRHYSKDVNKRRLIVNAMKKVEESWPEARKNVFGGNA